MMSTRNTAGRSHRPAVMGWLTFDFNHWLDEIQEDVMAPATLTHSILVVDDDPDIAPGLQDLLDRDGYQVNVAMTCADALARRCPSVQRRTCWTWVARRRRLLGPAHVTRTTTAASRHHLTAYTSTDRTVGSL